jgi:hypothetical protein
VVALGEAGEGICAGSVVDRPELVPDVLPEGPLEGHPVPAEGGVVELHEGVDLVEVLDDEVLIVGGHLLGVGVVHLAGARVHDDRGVGRVVVAEGEPLGRREAPLLGPHVGPAVDVDAHPEQQLPVRGDLRAEVDESGHSKAASSGSFSR